MQSTEKVSLTENSDKSLAEWPTLNDVCNNTKQFSVNGNGTKSAKNSRRRNKLPAEKSGGYDSSKENESSSQSANGRGARKKSSSKTKWVPVPIVPQPYRKKSYPRQFFDSNRNADFKKNEHGEFNNGQENGRSSMRSNNRFRGKRGRGYSHNWRPHREETSSGDIKIGSPNLTYEAECYYNNTVYYDPFLHNLYASALRDEELKTAIRRQIEYYFSDENLIKDIFLRRKMDSQGYVPLTLISTFRLIKNFTKSMDTIIEALKDSSKLEMVDDAKVRPVIDPLKWPLPDTLQSIIGLRTDVPEFFPGQPYITTLIEGMDNLSFNVDEVNGDRFPLSPDSVASLSPDQVVGEYFIDVNAEHTVNGIYYTGSISPENSVDPYVVNGCDYYSSTPSPDEHVNGFDYYSEQISNGVLYYTPNVNADEQVTNGISYFYNSSPDEVLSTGTDNSVEDQQEVLDNKSPEPAR